MDCEKTWRFDIYDDNWNFIETLRVGDDFDIEKWINFWGLTGCNWTSDPII